MKVGVNFEYTVHLKSDVGVDAGTVASLRLVRENGA